MEVKDKIIFPLDVNSTRMAVALVSELSQYVGAFKIGLELIYSMLASLVIYDDETATLNLKSIRDLFFEVGKQGFIDSKLDDIPNTVGGASIAISRMGVKMFNVHASAGRKAISAAVANKGDSLVLGVTVLTSIADECESIFGDEPSEKVLDFAEMLVDEGADGIICSALELKALARFNRLLKVVPGIRPEWAKKDDQERITTPAQAIKDGADYLVIGRPIREPPQQIGTPVAAAKKIAEEISQALIEIS